MAIIPSGVVGGVKETLGDINSPKYLIWKDCVFSFNDTPSSTNQNNNKTLWKVFPNPSQGIINISEEDLQYRKLMS
ncbi:MAG: hypothetical protein IPF67_16585 [Saprospiraceae bacterium]|nr:hypothetical protein [Candidatus Brachybacter algidus]